MYFMINDIISIVHLFQGYSIPKAVKIAEYHEFINNLPATDTPEAFGLHPNADIT